MNVENRINPTEAEALKELQALDKNKKERESQMIITKEFLDHHGAELEFQKWIFNQSENDAVKIIEKLTEEHRWDWLEWILTIILQAERWEKIQLLPR